MFWTCININSKFEEISKGLRKNIKEDSGKCKTIIYIDGVIVFTSDAYTWKHPNNSMFNQKHINKNLRIKLYRILNRYKKSHIFLFIDQ